MVKHNKQTQLYQLHLQVHPVHSVGLAFLPGKVTQSHLGESLSESNDNLSCDTRMPYLLTGPQHQGRFAKRWHRDLAIICNRQCNGCCCPKP
jgi:hypothetical protein